MSRLALSIAIAALACAPASAHAKEPETATRRRAGSALTMARATALAPRGAAPVLVAAPAVLPRVEAPGPRSAAPPVASRVFTEMARAAATYPSTTSTVLTGGNRVVKWPLVNDDQIGQAMHDLIVHAKKEVFIETMVLRDSAVAEKVRDAVHELARSRPDVPVYVRFTPRPTQMTWYARRQVEKFFDSPNVVVGAWKTRSIGPRWSVTRMAGDNVSHSKTVVVDNRIALVTDTNFQPESDPPKGWFQTGVVVEGPIAATIREQSADAWRLAAPSVHLPAPPPAHPGYARGIQMVTLGQHEIGGAMTSANQAYLAAFKNAERRICIFTPNLNDPDTMHALAQATAKADVQIILPKGFNQHAEALPGEGGNNDVNVRRLAQMASDPTHLHIRWNPDPQGKPSDGNGEWASHAKTIVVDDVVFVGSKNLDTQSAKVSRELSIAIPDRATADRAYTLFQSRWERAPVAFEASAQSSR